MAKLRLLSGARKDLRAISSYGTVQFGAAASDAYLVGLRGAFQMLRDQPRSGHPVVELRGSLRVFTYRKHRLFYYLDGDEVVIVRIFHHAQDALRWLGS